MGTEIVKQEIDHDTLEKVVIQGDLSQLSSSERVQYYHAVCKSMGLNPLTKPFDYIKLNNKLTLYAKRDCAEQLRRNHSISIEIKSREFAAGTYIVTASATDPDGRTDESIGAVYIENLKGDARANAMMKAETKAKRRVTLSIVGLGWLDEVEIETIPSAEIVNVTDDGDIVESVAPARVENQWEREIIKAAKDLQLVDNDVHACTILNASPLMAVEYKKLATNIGIAYLIGYARVSEKHPEEKFDFKTETTINLWNENKKELIDLANEKLGG